VAIQKQQWLIQDLKAAFSKMSRSEAQWAGSSTLKRVRVRGLGSAQRDTRLARAWDAAKHAGHHTARLVNAIDLARRVKHQ